MKAVYFWQPLITEHSVHTLNSIAEVLQKEAVFVIQKFEDGERKIQGWSRTSVEREIYFEPGLMGRLRAASFLLKTKGDIHFFGSPLENKLDILLYAILRFVNIKSVLISEPINDTSFPYFGNQTRTLSSVKMTLRKTYQRCVTKVLGNTSVLFAISEKSRQQYMEFGWDDNKIIEWGYFVPKKRYSKAEKAQKGRLSLLFVGNLIPRKGLHILLEAVSRVREKTDNLIELDVFGPGRIELYKAHANLFNYKGIIPFGKAQEVMSSYDLVVVPSYFDGWGVVVNESILAGVPVIVSKAAGASDLVDRFKCGLVVNKQDSLSYGKALMDIVDDSSYLEILRQNSQSAREMILPEISAEIGVAKLNLIWKNVR